MGFLLAVRVRVRERERVRVRLRVRVWVAAGRVLDLLGTAAALGSDRATRLHVSLLVTTMANTVAAPVADAGAVQVTVAEVLELEDVCVAPPLQPPDMRCAPDTGVPGQRDRHRSATKPCHRAQKRLVSGEFRACSAT